MLLKSKTTGKREKDMETSETETRIKEGRKKRWNGKKKETQRPNFNFTLWFR